MKTLKLIQKSKQEKKTDKTPPGINQDELLELFPLPQYFQVHFQHIHENVHDLHGEIAQLKDYVASVDKKLDRLLALLSRPQEQAL